MVDLAETKFLNEWVDSYTQHIDVIASWERLVTIYRDLDFLDPLTDAMRNAEFNDIAKETNKFLTRMRTSLSKARDIDAAIVVLQKAYAPGKNVPIDTRKAVAYQKLKQQWIAVGIHQLQAAKQQIFFEEPEEDEDA